MIKFEVSRYNSEGSMNIFDGPIYEYDYPDIQISEAVKNFSEDYENENDCEFIPGDENWEVLSVDRLLCDGIIGYFRYPNGVIEAARVFIESSAHKLITIEEYAKIHGKATISVQQKARRGGFRTARKVGRDWMIDASEPYKDNRVKSGDYIDWRKSK